MLNVGTFTQECPCGDARALPFNRPRHWHPDRHRLVGARAPVRHDATATPVSSWTCRRQSSRSTADGSDW